MRAVVAGGIAAAIAGGIAFAVSQSLPKEYDAQARVIVGSLTATNTDELDAYQRLAQTYAELATSSPLLTRIIDRIGLSDDPFQLATRIDVRAFGQGILLVDATAASPSEASQIANTVADEILVLATPAGEKASLAAVVQPAIPPDGPSSPRVLLNTLVAACLGFALGLGLGLLVASKESPASSGEERPPVSWPETRPAQARPPTAIERPARAPKGPSAVTEPGAILANGHATATYITGSTSLESGRRYVISVDQARLRLLGPVDIDPSVVALDLDVRGIDATSNEGRLLISQPANRSGSVLAFMSVIGTAPNDLATAIVEAAQAAGRT